MDALQLEVRLSKSCGLVKKVKKIWLKDIKRAKPCKTHTVSLIYAEMHRSCIAISSAARCQISELSPGDWVEFEVSWHLAKPTRCPSRLSRMLFSQQEAFIHLLSEFMCFNGQRCILMPFLALAITVSCTYCFWVFRCVLHHDCSSFTFI